MRDREQEEREGISAGQVWFVNPQILPPVRNYQIQGGRFVQPAANRILPPVRTTQIQIDYPNAYHFGERVSASFGQRREE